MVSKRLRFSHWWRRTGMEVRLFIFVIGVVFFSLLVYMQRPEDQDTYLSSNILVFALVNINVCFICILAFLIGRNIVKLIFDRKRKILGSKLRMRLVLSFVGLAMIPTIFLFILASGLLNQALGGWFNKHVEQSIDGAVLIARQHYDTLGLTVKRIGETVSDEIGSKPLIYQNNKTLNKYFQRIRSKNGLFSVGLYSKTGEQIAIASHTISALEEFNEPPPGKQSIQRAIKKGSEVLQVENGANQFIRAYVVTSYQGEKAFVTVTYRVPPRTTETFRSILDAHTEFLQMKLFKNPIRSGYLITFSLITGLILFAAIWIGFYIARELSVPIQRLAEGTQAVARGDYDFQIRVSGDDEIAYLVRSFNKMTSDLKQSRFDAERRRVLIETIMANLAVGVITLDTDMRITTVNPAARKMFAIDSAIDLRGQPVREVISLPVVDALMRVIESEGFGDTSSNEQPEVELEVNFEGQRRRLIGTAGHVLGAEGLDLGAVLIFDDITDLAQAQHMAAWREVARRIAHEIKNPLTPLQLCAQRLKKLLGNHQNSAAVVESADTIVEHVASIKRLADEFSKFARMPTIQYEETDLNRLVSNLVSRYAESQDEIVFTFIAAKEVPTVLLDQEQLRRAIINIIDNGLAALEEWNAGEVQKSIAVKTEYLASSQTVKVEISDTGPGINPESKSRIFEPYYTTREGGTGLGLAVVSSIVADHGGSVRVFDNSPHGCKFVIEIPIAPRETRGRKIAQGA